MGRYTAWLIAVGRLPADPFLGIKGPKQHHPLVTPLTDDQLRALDGAAGSRVVALLPLEDP